MASSISPISMSNSKGVPRRSTTACSLSPIPSPLSETHISRMDTTMCANIGVTAAGSGGGQQQVHSGPVAEESQTMSVLRLFLRRRDGNIAVEFAFIAGVLALLMMGLIDFGLGLCPRDGDVECRACGHPVRLGPAPVDWARGRIHRGADQRAEHSRCRGGRGRLPGQRSGGPANWQSPSFANAKTARPQPAFPPPRPPLTCTVSEGHAAGDADTSL